MQDIFVGYSYNQKKIINDHFKIIVENVNKISYLKRQ